jgi:hypothetical protein
LPLVIEGLPEGTRIEGYRDFVVQDLKVAAHNVQYRRTVYRLPDGTLRVADRPADVQDHFGCGRRPESVPLWRPEGGQGAGCLAKRAGNSAEGKLLFA